MVKFEDLFERDLYPDIIMPWIDEMTRLSNNREYEKAQEVLGKIKDELKSLRSNFPFRIDTIKDVYDLITCHAIRLDSENYSFPAFLSLVISVHDRKDELEGKKYSDTDNHRKIVAEEMVKLGITVPAKWKGIKPNRRFLDIAHQVNPFIADKELERRERVMLWKAIESGKRENIDMAAKRLRKYSTKGEI